MMTPSVGLFYAQGIKGFSALDPHQRRHDSDRTAQYYFIISLTALGMVFFHNYMFASAAATLTAKIRSLSFRAILRQDSEFCHRITVVRLSILLS
jgi:ATP-binding cassette subfamily B (MDR/TAP) protein 1